MLSSLLSGNGNMADIILELGATAFVVFCILPIHEFAHAFIAYKLGDNTARLSGRLTINPLAHVDLWGALMIFLVGFGYAKPVPVNMRNFKNPKVGMAIVALAGPVSNLILGIIFIFLSVLSNFTLGFYTKVGYAVCMFMTYAALVSINLAIFNLIPIPPLDGSRILNAILPDRIYYRIMQYERYILMGFFVLILLSRYIPVFDWMSDVSYWIYSKFSILFSRFFLMF